MVWFLKNVYLEAYEHFELWDKQQTEQSTQDHEMAEPIKTPTETAEDFND